MESTVVFGPSPPSWEAPRQCWAQWGHPTVVSETFLDCTAVWKRNSFSPILYSPPFPFKAGKGSTSQTKCSLALLPLPFIFHRCYLHHIFYINISYFILASASLRTEVGRVSYSCFMDILSSHNSLNIFYLFLQCPIQLTECILASRLKSYVVNWN